MARLVCVPFLFIYSLEHVGQEGGNNKSFAPESLLDSNSGTAGGGAAAKKLALLLTNPHKAEPVGKGVGAL